VRPEGAKALLHSANLLVLLPFQGERSRMEKEPRALP
jgi:hypothetical protein